MSHGIDRGMSEQAKLGFISKKTRWFDCFETQALRREVAVFAI